jgi:hypothetical protein
VAAAPQGCPPLTPWLAALTALTALGVFKLRLDPAQKDKPASPR